MLSWCKKWEALASPLLPTGFSQVTQGDRGTGKGSEGLANLRGLNQWVLQAFKVGGADLWCRATMVLLQGPVQAVQLSLDEERENSQGCDYSGPVLPTPSQEGWFVNLCTA